MSSLFPRKCSDDNFGQLPPFHPPGGRTRGRKNPRIIVGENCCHFGASYTRNYPGEKRHRNINLLLWLTSRWPWDKRQVVPGLTGPKSLCVRLETQENINFSLWLTGGLSQGCPDFQKVYVFKVYVPFLALKLSWSKCALDSTCRTHVSASGGCTVRAPWNSPGGLKGNTHEREHSNMKVCCAFSHETQERKRGEGT